MLFFYFSLKKRCSIGNKAVDLNSIKEPMERQTWPSKMQYALSIGGCLLVAVIGRFFTDQSINDWYPTLNKPHLTPPEWIFPVVWPILYVMMGVALALVWKKRAAFFSYFIFGVQLFLNFIWSYLFFTLRSPFLGLVDIIGLNIAILLTIYFFKKSSSLAGWLLVPYLFWVFFATYLNAWIWLYN